MSYALSFAEDFFVYDDDRVGRNERPTCVYQAILGLRVETLRDIGRDVFGLAVGQVSPEAILEKILETNTCSNLDEPVEVWIDPEGDYRVAVYSSPA